MHIECRKVRSVGWKFWLFPYGFGCFLGRIVFSVGHDVRQRIYTLQGTDHD